jgi:hypothetical protein
VVGVSEGLLALADQASRILYLVDPADDEWNGSDAVHWSYRIPDEMLKLFNDVKLRNSGFFGKQVMLLCTTGSAAVVAYPNGEVLWMAHSPGSNAHSIELLPNGNVAVAASTAGWVRVYASSQGPQATDYTQFSLASAHGVQWDPQNQVLWALGFDRLVALEVNGTANPRIKELFSVELPTKNGHDLQPVTGDPDRLWVTTGTQVYQFVKSNRSFDSAYADQASISLSSVKSIGNFPSGQVVLTRPAPGSLYSWTTDTVHFFRPTAVKHRVGLALYKVRIWCADYL